MSAPARADRGTTSARDAARPDANTSPVTRPETPPDARGVVPVPRCQPTPIATPPAARRPRFEGVRQVARSRGAAMAVLFALDQFLRRTTGERIKIELNTLVAQPLGVGPGPGLREAAGTTVRSVMPHDELAASLPRPQAVNRQRWAQGAQCFVAMVKGELAATMWVQPHEHHEEQVRCTYLVGNGGVAVWDFDLLVLPRYRLGRTFVRLWAHVDAELAARGVRWSFSQISPFNEGSVRSHAQLGAVPIGWVCHIVVGPLQGSIASLAPRWHLSWRAGDAPTYRLQPPAGQDAGAPLDRAR